MIRHLLCAPPAGDDLGQELEGETNALRIGVETLCLGTHSLFLLVSNQVGSPAELKHIIKRRKRN